MGDDLAVSPEGRFTIRLASLTTLPFRPSPPPFFFFLLLLSLSLLPQTIEDRDLSPSPHPERCVVDRGSHVEQVVYTLVKSYL